MTSRKVTSRKAPSEARLRPRVFLPSFRTRTGLASRRGDRGLDNTLQHKAFLLLLAAITLAFFWLLLPFFSAIFWAVILAIIFQPLQRRFERHFGDRSNLAAALSVVVCIVIAIIPMAIIFGALVNEGAKLVQRAQDGGIDATTILNEIQSHVPGWGQRILDRLGGGDFDFASIRDRIVGLVQQLGQLIAGRAINLGQNTLRFVVATGIMLYVLFFLFRDGRAVARTIRAAMPLSDAYNQRLLNKFVGVVRATVKGNVVIAVIQGTIGGVALWALGIDAALLWGALMVFLSLLPAIGAAIVWVPIAIYLFLTGAVWEGVALVFVGAAVIGLVDNILRPVLVGKDTRLPDYVILVSTVGGLSIFGINGFVIGPLIAALFVAVWTIFREERDEARRREAVSGPLVLDGTAPVDRPTTIIRP
jgi:predicted PurR-regulated permease PerM